MKSAILLFIVTLTISLCSCFVDSKLPSTPVPTDSAVTNSAKDDAAVPPVAIGEFESGGTGGNSISPSNEPDARDIVDNTDVEVVVDHEPDDAGAIDAGIIDAKVDDSATVDVVSEEDFGLSCDGTLCPSVTLPAQQCCTEQQDVEERRAQAENRCGIARLAIEGCTELEQMGALDDSCPSFEPTGALIEEPGCCTIAGRCGTFDVADGIGCHENESIDRVCGQETIDESQSCEPTGIYAVKAELDLAWGGQTGLLFDITDDGRGISTIVLKITIDSVDADNSFIAEVQPCGAELPLISNSLICESYRPTFPNEIWDGGTMPPISVSGSFACLHPGCMLSIGPASASIGIELEDEGSAWPTANEASTVRCPAGTGEECYPDHDGDGYPGITVTMPAGESPGSQACSSGYKMSAAPLSANLSIILNTVYRTDRLHLGVRVRLGASGQLTDDCGLTDVVGMAEYVQSRAIGCMLEPGSHDLFAASAGEDDLCNEQQLLFMNQNLPIYDILRLGDIPNWRLNLPADKRVPSDGPRFQFVRLGDVDQDTNCSEVRDAF